jgi:hypothetical protein
MIEAMKQALEALKQMQAKANFECWNLEICDEAIKALRQAIAELESQESNPIKDGWQLSVGDGHSGYGVYAHMEEYPEEGAFLLLPIKELESQEPVAWMHVQENYEEPSFRQLADDEVERGWEQYPLYTHPPQRTEQNFCSRCGKRTADLTTIHTCTPPQD